MAVTINIAVSKSYDPAPFTECLGWLLQSIPFSFLTDYTVYGWECGPALSDGNLVLESKYAVDGMTGDPPEPSTVWEVRQMMVPGLHAGDMPLHWVVMRGALNCGFQAMYDPANDPPIPKMEVATACSTMIELYVKGLIEGMCGGTWHANTPIYNDTGVWGDMMVIWSGTARINQQIFPVNITVQLFDNGQTGHAGSGAYNPNVMAGVQSIVTKLDTAPIVSVLEEMAMSRLDISANNGAQMFSVKGGARTD